VLRQTETDTSRPAGDNSYLTFEFLHGSSFITQE
jgi:hypothetical protein